MKWLKPMAVTVLTLVGTGLLLLAVVSWIIKTSKSLPEGLFPLITSILCCGAAFAGGLAGSACSREKGLLLGLFGSSVLLTVLLTYSAVTGMLELNPACLGKAAAILLSGAIGGILGVNRKGRVKF